MRQTDAENNARLYGITLAKTGPRMTREKWMSGTLSRDGINGKVMGIPDNNSIAGDIRDASRRLLVSPFTLLRWEKQGMPVVRYYPWKRYDIDLIKKWLIENQMELPREVDEREVDFFLDYVLKEVQAGRVTIEEAKEALMSQ